MSESLNQAIQALAQLNLEPGQMQRVQVNGYYLEVRRPADEEKSSFADTVMLEPWIAFPRGEPDMLLPLGVEEDRLPVPPDIPPDEEESA